MTPPRTDGRTRRIVFLGDLVDRGPKTPAVLRLAMRLVDRGLAMCVPGNHDAKLSKALRGRKVKVAHGLERSLAQLECEGEAFRLEVARFIEGLPSHLVLDGGRLVAAHAGMQESMQGRVAAGVHEFALFGATTGRMDELGLPERLDWAADYRGTRTVVYGHTPTARPRWVNDTICIDTGCVFGGALSALRWPERELVEIPAHRTYAEPRRPL